MIYFDNAATTKCSKHAIAAMVKYSNEFYHNPSTPYAQGMAVKNDITRAREELLEFLHADGTIIYTSSGTESNNMTLFGVRKPREARIIISAGEHPSIVAPANILKQKGYDIVTCPIDESGRVKIRELDAMINDKTCLVSVMHVNNHTGAVNDLALISKTVKQHSKDIIVHSDGSQAFGKIATNLKKCGVDLYTISGHKVGGPKGIAALFVKKGINLTPMLFGGGQEFGVRSSTENVPGIMGLCAVTADIYSSLDMRLSRMRTVRDKIEKGLRHIREIKFIADGEVSPYILAISSQKVRGELMQHSLERRGVLVSTGSACSTNKMSNKVADALGLTGNYKYGLLRISLSSESTLDEAREFIEIYFKVYKEFSGYGD
ncbi:MAG: cysteine desulfurase [Christensenellaceae bacterium]|jgi:cysteine desulfurase|nr:cysteine desulfurase [Christensenellaceae bacterium]